MTLRAISLALGQESHVLIDRGDLLWQRLHNRLQWLGGEVGDRVAEERRVRSDSGPRPWIRQITPLRDSSTYRLSLNGHIGEVRDAVFSPDSAALATAGMDGLVRLWDAATGECLHTLEEHAGPVWSAAFSPDGSRLASSSRDRTARVWDV